MQFIAKQAMAWGEFLTRSSEMTHSEPLKPCEQQYSTVFIDLFSSYDSYHLADTHTHTQEEVLQHK